MLVAGDPTATDGDPRNIDRLLGVRWSLADDERALEAQAQASRSNHARRLGQRTPTTPRRHRAHRQRRQSHLLPCNEPIHAAEDWHLDHTDNREGYLGVSHATCNLRDGANKTNRRRPPQPFVEMPHRWSQRWYDDPPIGTVVLGHERVIYIGNGEWQPLDAGALGVGEGR